MSDTTTYLVAADGTPLKRKLAQSLMRSRARAFGLALPLLAFILVLFVYPIANFLTQAFYDERFATLMPGTTEVLKDWDAVSEPTEEMAAMLVADLVVAKEVHDSGVGVAKLTAVALIKDEDEINIIKKGVNYGWPKITYGINYSGTTITKDKELPGMAQPLYYWLPSIAPSSFEYISSDVYPGWKGSMLAGALVFKYVERIGVENDKVIYRSKIAEGLGRPRDIKQGPDGYIYVAMEKKGVYKIVPKRVMPK